MVGEGGIHLDFGTFDIVLVRCLNYNILVQGYSIQVLALYCSGSYIPGLWPLQNVWSTPNVFDHFWQWCCSDQSSPHLQIGLLSSSLHHLLILESPLIGVCSCFGTLSCIVQCPGILNVLDYPELVGTEIQAYQNPVEAWSVLQNWW